MAKFCSVSFDNLVTLLGTCRPIPTRQIFARTRSRVINNFKSDGNFNTSDSKLHFRRCEYSAPGPISSYAQQRDCTGQHLQHCIIPNFCRKLAIAIGSCKNETTAHFVLKIASVKLDQTFYLARKFLK